MAQRARFYDSVAGDRVYGSDAWAQLLTALVGDGIIAGIGDEYVVSESNPPAMSVDVGTGASITQGYFHETYSAVATVAIAAADLTNPRIDRVVIRRDLAARTSSVAVITGTPAASPSAPALVEDANGFWDIPLARVAVAALSVSILDADITDEREDRAVLHLTAPGTPTTAAPGDAASTGTGPAYAYDDHTHGNPALVPTGAIMPWSVASPPTGWLICNGAAVSRATYAALFAVIGTGYGVGDGSTTFNLPDLQGRVIVGHKSTDAAFDAVGETGGAQTHTHAGHSNHSAISAHTGAAVGAIGAEAGHTHAGTGSTGAEAGHTHAGSGNTGAEAGHTHAGAGSTGGDSGHYHGGGNATGGAGNHTHTLNGHQHLVQTGYLNTQVQSAGDQLNSVPSTGANAASKPAHYHTFDYTGWTSAPNSDGTSAPGDHTHTDPSTSWAAQSHTHAASSVGAGSSHAHATGNVGSGSSHSHSASSVSAGTSHTHAQGSVTQPSAHDAISAHSAHDSPSHLMPYMALPMIIKA